MAIEGVNTYSSAAVADTSSCKMDKAEKKDKKSGDSVEEYFERLKRKFSGFKINTNGGVMYASKGNPVVNLSTKCLKRMASDPAFAKKVEFSLSGEAKANSMIYGFAKRDGVELYNYQVTYDEDGNSQCSFGMRTAQKSSETKGTSNDKKHMEEKIKERKKEREELLKKWREEAMSKRAGVYYDCNYIGTYIEDSSNSIDMRV